MHGCSETGGPNSLLGLPALQTSPSGWNGWALPISSNIRPKLLMVCEIVFEDVQSWCCVDCCTPTVLLHTGSERFGSCREDLCVCVLYIYWRGCCCVHSDFQSVVQVYVHVLLPVWLTSMWVICRYSWFWVEHLSEIRARTIFRRWKRSPLLY